MSSAGWTATWVLLIESHIQFHQAYALCPKNTAIKTAAAPRHCNNVTMSPDEAQAAFDMSDRENWAVWIYDLRRSTLYPVASDGHSIAPIWTPDGKRVVFLSYRFGKCQRFVQRVDGSGKTMGTT
jgi:Tol biopolymer transport system component